MSGTLECRAGIKLGMTVERTATVAVLDFSPRAMVRVTVALDTLQDAVLTHGRVAVEQYIGERVMRSLAGPELAPGEVPEIRVSLPVAEAFVTPQKD